MKSGAKLPAAESFFVLGRATDGQNLPHFLYFLSFCRIVIENAHPNILGASPSV